MTSSFFLLLCFANDVHFAGNDFHSPSKHQFKVYPILLLKSRMKHISFEKSFDCKTVKKKIICLLFSYGCHYYILMEEMLGFNYEV